MNPMPALPSMPAGQSGLTPSPTGRVDDQRKTPRRRARAAIRLSTAQGVVAQGRLLDISKSGVRVLLSRCTGPLHEGDAVLLETTEEHALGMAMRSGVIIWSGAERKDGQGQWGVQLTDALNVSLEPIDVDRIKVDASLALRLPAARALRWQMLPFAAADGRVLIAVSSTPAPRSLAAVQKVYGLAPELHIAHAEPLAAAINRIYSDESLAGAGAIGGSAALVSRPSMDRGASIDMDAVVADDDDAVGLCGRLLSAAIVQDASDIHIDSYETATRIRFRVDGQLETVHHTSPQQGAALISRIKVLAGLDISEKRAAQDGRMRHPHGQAMVDVRVASIPAKQGERITLRLLARQADKLTLQTLGMAPHQLAHLHHAIAKPHGLVLITGPTGSGKSTTLYAAIRQLIAHEALNVITIEDPVEYQIEGITQVEVDQKEKVTFAKALRSTLRHDPDVVMVGEIRDGETAGIAVKSALTGHMVLSTLHTNSAAGAITRLRDMGLPHYLLAATLRLVVAQRLARRLCQHCSSPAPCLADLAHALGAASLAGRTLYEPQGCLYCGQRGYAGRLALFEMLPGDAALAKLIAQDVAEDRYAQHMAQAGLPTLLDDAVDKLLDGRTSMQEALRHVVA